jgi:hypothetical protein
MSVPAGVKVVTVPFTFATFSRLDFPLGRSVAISAVVSDAAGTDTTAITGNMVVFAND